MSSQITLKVSPEVAKEMPMVDLAFNVLRAVNTPMYYRDLMQEIAKIKDISDEQVMQVIAQVYTEINIDGRFACVGNNLWGLKRWYPVERTEDAMGGNTKHPRIINDEDDDDMDDETLFADEADDDFDVIDDDTEAFDADVEEVEDDAEEEIEEELSEDMDDELDDVDASEDEDIDDEDDDDEDGK
ncbi:MAG: DNA-directed RNA polymerase subunit delta [Paenibacillaceae bacterium]